MRLGGVTKAWDTRLLNFSSPGFAASAALLQHACAEPPGSGSAAVGDAEKISAATKAASAPPTCLILSPRQLRRIRSVFGRKLSVSSVRYRPRSGSRLRLYRKFFSRRRQMLTDPDEP